MAWQAAAAAGVESGAGAGAGAGAGRQIGPAAPQHPISSHKPVSVAHLSEKDEGQYAIGEKPRESAAEENIRGSPGINRASHIATDKGPESRSLECSGEVSPAMDVYGSACGDGTDAAAVTVNC